MVCGSWMPSPPGVRVSAREPEGGGGGPSPEETSSSTELAWNGSMPALRRAARVKNRRGGRPCFGPAAAMRSWAGQPLAECRRIAARFRAGFSAVGKACGNAVTSSVGKKARSPTRGAPERCLRQSAVCCDEAACGGHWGLSARRGQRKGRASTGSGRGGGALNTKFGSHKADSPLLKFQKIQLTIAQHRSERQNFSSVEGWCDTTPRWHFSADGAGLRACDGINIGGGWHALVDQVDVKLSARISAKEKRERMTEEICRG